MQNNKGEEYLKKFPKLNKWINQCLCCGEKGYRPDMPERISVFEGAMDTLYIKKYFKPLPLNEAGLCEVCAKIQDKS